MNAKVKLAAMLAAMAVSAGAQAAIIDLFSTDQGPYTDTSANAADTGTLITSGVGGTAGVADPTILGGNRDLFVSKLTDPLNLASRVATASVGGSVLDFSTSTSTTGRAQIQWDGAEGTNAIDFGGLSNYDLTVGGTANAFSLNIVFSDNGFTFKITAYTDSTNFTEVEIDANEHLAPATTNIAFAAFALATGDYLGNTVHVTQHGTGVDLTDLGALVVDIDQTGQKTSLDLTVDNVTTVPEPASLALLGIGLAGLGAVRSRKTA